MSPRSVAMIPQKIRSDRAAAEMPTLRRRRSLAARHVVAMPTLRRDAGSPIVVRAPGLTIRISRRWFFALQLEARFSLLRILHGVVGKLGDQDSGWLPKDTGKLRGRTRPFMATAKARRFRVWSTAPYSRYVTTAPPAWARAIATIRDRISAHHKIVPIECTVTRRGRTVRRVLRYRFRLADLRIRVYPVVRHRLPNEIEGRYAPVLSLRRRVIAAAYTQFTGARASPARSGTPGSAEWFGSRTTVAPGGKVGRLPPLPSNPTHAQADEWLRTTSERLGLAVYEGGKSPFEGGLGIFHPRDPYQIGAQHSAIWLDGGLSPTERLRTFAHEVGHALDYHRRGPFAARGAGTWNDEARTERVAMMFENLFADRVGGGIRDRGQTEWHLGILGLDWQEFEMDFRDARAGFGAWIGKGGE